MLVNTKERLLKFLEESNISKSQFYNECDLKRGLLDSDKMKGTVSDTTIAKILATYPELNYKWLLLGQGEMLNKTLSTDYVEANPPTSEPLSTNLPNAGIPLIPLSAMAGRFTGEQQILECECERYIVPAFKGADFLIHVKGDSMQPRYMSGDIVACKRVPMERLFFQWNHTYVLDTDQGALIKRIKPGTDEKHVSIVSDNEEYAPFELPVECIYGVALVMGTIRLE